MIESPSNPTVKALRALHAARARREQSLFLVEGVRAIEDGLKAGLWPATCLYNVELLGRTERGQALLKLLLAQASRNRQHPAPLEASERALAAVSDTQHPQGIVATFPMLKQAGASQPVERPALALICDQIQDPGNLGTLLRAAEAAGVTAVWLTPRCADIYSPKVVRAGMGVHFRLAMYTDKQWDDIETDLQAVGVAPDRVFATEMEAAQPYYAVDWQAPAALIVSNEAHGLSPEARKLAARAGSISVPMSGGTESLNAAIAGAVILFEAARQRHAEGKTQT